MQRNGVKHMQTVQQIATAAAQALRADPDYLQMYYDGDAGWLDCIDDIVPLVDDANYSAVMDELHRHLRK